MKIVTKEIADPNFEKWFHLLNYNSMYMMLKYPDEFRKTMIEHDKIHSRARLAADSCRIAVLDYSLLFKDEALFHDLRRGAIGKSKRLAAENDKVAKEDKWLLSRRLKVQEQMRRDHSALISDLLKRQREIKEEHTRGEAETNRELIEGALKAVDWASGAYGEHGRAVICAVVLMTLNSVSRHAHPEAALFIDTLIKDILLHEETESVRDAAWENAGLKDTGALRKQDLFVFDNAKAAKQQEISGR